MEERLSEHPVQKYDSVDVYRSRVICDSGHRHRYVMTVLNEAGDAYVCPDCGASVGFSRVYPLEKHTDWVRVLAGAWEGKTVAIVMVLSDGRILVKRDDGREASLLPDVLQLPESIRREVARYSATYPPRSEA